MDASSGDEARARLRGKRMAHAIVVTTAVAFIGASAAQIIPAVFGIPARVGPPPTPGRAETACMEAIRSLSFALDRATEKAWSPEVNRAAAPRADGSAILQAFHEGLLPEWNAEASIGLACAKSREGVEAWAVLLRLRRAEEQFALRGFTDLAPLRSDVAAHLPADLR
ncbi:MAG: hypothetical protein M3O46_01290 [Myxococcota bacterium]|nr:hypothetical protein [Myxococcota bacterium]